jgi:hypothetical protein
VSRPPDQVAPLTVWPVTRRGLATAAVACAVLTSAAGAALGDGGWATSAALAHAVAAVWTLADSRAVDGQVAAGVGMAWALVPGTDGPVVGVVVVVVGVVLTSELLGATTRLGMVVERDPRPELRRAGGAALVALVASAATLAAGSLAGPSGLLATAVAGTGCALLAVALRAAGGVSARGGVAGRGGGQR